MPEDYMKRRHLRELDRLMRRVLQLDDILCRDAILDIGRADKLKSQIKRAQEKLDLIYDRLEFVDPDTDS
jgi:hypothetical protein